MFLAPLIVILALSLQPSLITSKVIETSRETEDSKLKSQTELNEAFDESLSGAIDQFDDKLSPYEIPDLKLGFNRRIAFVNWKGELKLSHIQLSQLQNVERTSDVVLVDGPDVKFGLKDFLTSGFKKAEGKSICKVSTKLLFERVFYTADFGVHFLNLGTSRHLEGWTDDINVEATISYDKKIDTLSLENLMIHSMSEPRLKVHGHGIVLDSVSNFMIQTGVRVFKRTHKFILERVIKSLLGDKIPNSDILKEILGHICHNQ